MTRPGDHKGSWPAANPEDPTTPADGAEHQAIVLAAQAQAERAAFLAYRQEVLRDHDANRSETRGALGCLFLILAPAGVLLLFIHPAMGLPVLVLAVSLRLIGTARRDAQRRREQKARAEAERIWATRR